MPGHERRLSLAVELAIAQDADVTLFQEVWSRRAAEQLVTRLRAEGYSASVPRDSRLGRGSGGLLTAVRAPWQLPTPAAFVAFTVSAPIWKVWEGDGLMHKGVLQTTMSQGSAIFEIRNTHLQSQYALRWQTDGRIAGVRHYRDVRHAQFRQLIDEAVRTASRPLIVAGDFNTFPEELSAMGLPSTWHEASAPARSVAAPATYVERGCPMGWFDYVFVDDDLRQITTKAARVVDSSGLSDHHAVVVDLRIASTS